MGHIRSDTLSLSALALNLQQLLEYNLGIKRKRKYWQKRGAKFQNNLKANPTRAEAILLKALRRRFINFKFQRMFYSSNRCYIVDFVIPTSKHVKLAIEIDGSSHDNRKAYDAKRTKWLAANRNLKVVRYTNLRVFTDVDGVVDDLLKLGAYHTAKLIKHQDNVAKYAEMNRIKNAPDSAVPTAFT